MEKNCAQCGETFESRSANHSYCNTQCRYDNSNGRPAWQSKNRKAIGFAWDPVQPPRKIERPKVAAPKSPIGDWRKAVILPDPQIGFRRLPDGSLDPFHSEAALDIALQIVKREKPDKIVWLGDFLDLPSFGRYRLEEGFAQTTQPAIDRGYEILLEFSLHCNEMALIEGNHDARLQNYITDNALASAGLRRAKDPPSQWPVLSVPFLLRLNDLGIEYVGGYPSGAHYLNDNLACIHGHKVKSNGSTAAELVKDEQVSTIFGHVHRRELHSKTRNHRGRPRQIIAASPGTLSRIDGAVPSYKSATLLTGKPAIHFEDWAQGLAVVRYEIGGDQRFEYQDIGIFDGWALWNGKEYTSKCPT